LGIAGKRAPSSIFIYGVKLAYHYVEFYTDYKSRGLRQLKCHETLNLHL